MNLKILYSKGIVNLFKESGSKNIKIKWKILLFYPREKALLNRLKRHQKMSIEKLLDNKKTKKG